MIWVRLKQVTFYAIELIIFSALSYFFIGLVYIGEFGPLTIVFPILFGFVRSCLFIEKSIQRILIRNLIFVGVAYLAFRLTGSHFDPPPEDAFEYLVLLFENLASIRLEQILGALGAYLLLCCGNVTGKALRSLHSKGLKHYAFNRKGSNKNSLKISKESLEKAKKLKAAASAERPEVAASEDSENELQPPASADSPVDTSTKKQKKSPEEIDRGFELHKKRIELIGGYLTAFQPLFVFLTGIIGSVLMYLGTR